MGDPARGRYRTAFGRAVTALCFVVVWLALVLPDTPGLLTSGLFVRIPAEGLALAVVALLLPRRLIRPAAVLLGVAVALLVILKVLNMGLHEVFDRDFDPVSDWGYLPPGFGVLSDSVGQRAAVATAVAAGVVVVGLLTVMPACLMRALRAVRRHRAGSLRATGALTIVWALCAVLGVQLANVPVSSANTGALVYGEVRHLRAGLHDHSVFADQIAPDRYADRPAQQLLTGLHGKDVLLVFVESYGRAAVQGSSFSPGVDAVLDAGSRQLRAAGFSARSAFLTSPAFGGASWLAHATLQSGLWVDSQQRFDQLLATDRLTLTAAFEKAGWRTVFDVPAVTRPWPDGTAFYRFDKLYDATNVGYRGPPFAYTNMPDQYTLATFWRRELAPAHRRPVMAEIDLISSHIPWAPLPHMVPWSQVGDGSVFNGMPQRGRTPEEVFQDPDAVRAAYGQSIAYSLGCLISFLRTHPDPDLVLVLLGDHQPPHVTGPGASHDVPVSVIAHDPAVLRRLAAWGWQNGLHPSPTAPVWRMDTFRNRFLSAYGPR